MVPAFTRLLGFSVKQAIGTSLAVIVPTAIMGVFKHQRADNVAWTGLTSTQTYRWAIVYRFGTNDADSDLIAAIDMNAAGINLTGITDYTIKWDGAASNGRLFSLT